MADFLKNIDVGVIVIQFAVLLFSLSIHEASHAWTADYFGDYTARYLGRVSLNPIPHIDLIGTVLFPLLQFFTHFPLIGWAKPVPINPVHLKNPRKDQIFISIAGPAANLLAGGIAFALLVLLKKGSPQAHLLIDYMTAVGQIPVNQSILAPILGILFYAMIINLVLALFNFIPIPPLDGHWILYGLLPAHAAAAFERMGSYGFIILYALMFMGAFNFLLIPVRIALKLLRVF
jgi:Zn-dependent protease